jgi:hypothetical protein
METNYHYATVTDAITALKEKSFTVDFNLDDNYISWNSGKFAHDEFEIVEIYRYEGNSDPGDEATVYGIESATGVKGILVTGYGASAVSTSAAMLRKLGVKHE